MILYDKGYRDFVKCAELAKKEFSNVEFEVWGTLDVTYPNAVSDEQLKKDCQKEVIKYKGFIVDMNEALKRKGLVVMLPSYYGEGLNRSLMEACATGKPIVTTNIAGCRETVIDGENGFIVSPKNVDELLNAVRRYMNMSTGERSEMSKRSRQLAEERFSVSDVVKIYDKLI
jgi:glycosyltransferase involved in cell wall biosynthesis